MKIITFIIHELSGKHNINWEELDKLCRLSTERDFAGGAYTGRDGIEHPIPKLTEERKISLEKEYEKD